nr:MAG TPA: hypothetical protein [Caudoviricetes sp.]
MPYSTFLRLILPLAFLIRNACISTLHASCLHRRLYTPTFAASPNDGRNL